MGGTVLKRRGTAVTGLRSIIFSVKSVNKSFSLSEGLLGIDGNLIIRKQEM